MTKSHKVKRESEVPQSCLTLCNPVDYSPLGFSVHGILQARILEWVASSFSYSLMIILYGKEGGRVRGGEEEDNYLSQKLLVTNLGNCTKW